MDAWNITVGKTRVTHSNFESGEGLVVGLEDSSAHVKWDTPAAHLVAMGRTDTSRHLVSWLEPVETVTTRPDPRAVKVGATVTLIRGKAIVVDEVTAVSTSAPNSATPFVAFGLSQDALGESKRAVSVDPATPELGWVLAAHQPAFEVDTLASAIWEASRADEGTISATGANKVAAAIRAKFVVIDPAEVDEEELYKAVLPKVTHDLGDGSIYRVKRTIVHTLLALGIEAS